MKITFRHISISLLIILLLTLCKNSSNNKLDEEKIVLLQKYATNIEKGNKDLIIILNNSNGINEKGDYIEFIDKTVINKSLEIFKKEGYTILTLNLPCLIDIECLNKYYEVANLTISLKPKAIIFNSPASGLNTDTLGKMFNNASIPIYVYQTESALDYVLYVGPDNKKLGVTAAKAIKPNLSKNDKVLYIETVRLINGDPLDNGYERIEAVRTELNKAGVLEYKTIFTEWSKTKTYEEILKLLSKDSNVDYIITPSVETAEGAIFALEKLNLQNKIKVICLDITETSIKLLKQEKIEGLVGQELIKQGETLATSIINQENNSKPLKKKILFSSDYINLNNIESYKQENGDYNY